MRHFLRCVSILFCSVVLFVPVSYANPDQSSGKTKFYNFDDLLINGKVKKPQILWTDARQKVRFDRLLKLKKDFLPKLQDTRRDPTLR
tara:strand:+ start:44 stop:307 length:264 start_codon:yes stop_codon:yes gene_type:complete